MVFGRGRVGRPGLLGTVARTAIVAGTANATSNAMNRRRQSHEEQQQAPPPPPPPPPPVAAPPAEHDLVGQIQKLAALRDAGGCSTRTSSRQRKQSFLPDPPGAVEPHGPLSAVAEKGPSDLPASYFRARLTAETSARNDAVVIDVAIPAPHTVTAAPEGPVTEAST